MNEDRRALADLLARLHGMGVTTAPNDLQCQHCKGTGQYRKPGDCFECKGEGYHLPEHCEVLPILGEMMNVPTPGITMGDVLAAAKKAGVY